MVIFAFFIVLTAIKRDFILTHYYYENTFTVSLMDILLLFLIIQVIFCILANIIHIMAFSVSSYFYPHNKNQYSYNIILNDRVPFIIIISSYIIIMPLTPTQQISSCSFFYNYIKPYVPDIHPAVLVEENIIEFMSLPFITFQTESIE